MAVKDILPTTNLSWDDIRDTLNANGGKVTNEVASAFSSAANINKWSKHKPVPYSKPFCQDFDSSRSDYDATWWKGTGNCGLSPSVSGSLDSAIKGDWIYTLPKGGGSNEPFRLGDFAGYYTKSTPPITHGYNGTITVDKIKETVLRLMFAVTYDDSFVFTPADMLSLKDTYITAYVTNGSHKIKVSASNVISDKNNIDGATTITIPTSWLYKGNYECYIVFSTSRFELGKPEPSSNFLPFVSSEESSSKFNISVVEVSPVQISFLSLSYSVFGKFITREDAGDIFENDMVWVMYSTGDIVAEISIHNTSGTSVNILSNQLRIQTTTVHDTSITRAGTLYENNKIVQGVTVPANSSKNVKVLFERIILYKGNSVVYPSGETRLKTISSTMLFYSQDGNSQIGTGGSVIFNVKYSPSRNEWVKETINQ